MKLLTGAKRRRRQLEEEAAAVRFLIQWWACAKLRQLEEAERGKR
jgi:hypothetical protein